MKYRKHLKELRFVHNAERNEFASNLPEKSNGWRKPERLVSALLLALLIGKPGELFLL